MLLFDILKQNLNFLTIKLFTVPQSAVTEVQVSGTSLHLPFWEDIDKSKCVIRVGLSNTL
jgi:hypothetical protein